MTLPSVPTAAVQLPLPSLAVQVIVWPWAITKVEARHKSAKAPPTVFPTVRNICFSLFAVGCTCAARDSSITKKNRIPSFPQGPSERNNHTYEKFNYSELTPQTANCLKSNEKRCKGNMRTSLSGGFLSSSSGE